MILLVLLFGCFLVALTIAFVFAGKSPLIPIVQLGCMAVGNLFKQALSPFLLIFRSLLPKQSRYETTSTSTFTTWS